MVTAHPVIRLPIFLMGVLAGLQVLRAHSDWENFEDPNLDKNILHSLVPWGCGKSIGGSKKEEQERLITPAKVDKEKATKIWLGGPQPHGTWTNLCSNFVDKSVKAARMRQDG